MSNGSKRDSPLVNSVLALQSHLAELERIGGKITSTDMTADVDAEFVQKLLMRFAVCGQSVSDEVRNLSTHLKEAQGRAEAIAEAVSRQANAFSIRRNEESEYLERFRLLAEKVRALNASLTGEDGTALMANLPVIEQQLPGLIEELQHLRNSARASRLKTLEKSAESLTQSLQALQLKLAGRA